MPHLRQPPPLAVERPKSPSSFDPSKCTVCARCSKRYVEPSLIARGPKKGEPCEKCVVCSNRIKAADCPEHLMVPTDHSGGYVVCSKCEKRYVEPTAVFKQGPNKGEQCDKCDVCRSRVLAQSFPQHLIIPKEHISAKTKRSLSPTQKNSGVEQPADNNASVEEMWIKSLEPESQSLLLHGKAILKSLTSTTHVLDLPRATGDIQWDAIEDRLRDIYDLDRLFQGFRSLRKHYRTEVNTVAPVGLIAVSLNNCAVRSQLPFKVCWLHIPVRKGAHMEQTGASSTLFLALSAWSSTEKDWWKAATPQQRLKACSTWESSIRPSAKAIGVPYAETNSPRIEQDGQVYFEVYLRRCLVWAGRMSDSVENTASSGALFFPEGHKLAEKLLCRTSADLLNILCQAFHDQVSKLEWKTLQQKALDELHAVRQPSKLVRDASQRLIDASHRSKGEGSV